MKDLRAAWLVISKLLSIYWYRKHIIKNHNGQAEVLVLSKCTKPCLTVPSSLKFLHNTCKSWLVIPILVKMLAASLLYGNCVQGPRKRCCCLQRVWYQSYIVPWLWRYYSLWWRTNISCNTVTTSWLCDGYSTFNWRRWDGPCQIWLTAVRLLQIYTTDVLLATLRPPIPLERRSGTMLMAEISKTSCNHYRSTEYETDTWTRDPRILHPYFYLSVLCTVKY